MAQQPFKKGDTVTTKLNGQEVEAVVTMIWKDEVQVRTPDGELRWRTVRTVQPKGDVADAAGATPEQTAATTETPSVRRSGKRGKRMKPARRRHKKAREVVARLNPT